VCGVPDEAQPAVAHTAKRIPVAILALDKR
jgi:hypothetical protein